MSVGDVGGGEVGKNVGLRVRISLGIRNEYMFNFKCNSFNIFNYNVYIHEH